MTMIIPPFSAKNARNEIVSHHPEGVTAIEIWFGEF
jgi:hypothetical protein